MFFRPRIQRKTVPEPVEAQQPPGVLFPWAAGMTLTAVDEVTIALPRALIAPDEPIRSVIRCDDGAQVGAGANDTLLIRLDPEMSATLMRGSQAYLVADDSRARRVLIRKSPKTGPGGG